MIRRLSPRPRGSFTDPALPSPPVPLTPVANWLRRASVGAQSLEDAAIAAGAAIGALDQLVRGPQKWAGAWRQRLALLAAAMTARQSGRIEDEAALRDAVLLARPGDAVGPAGLLLMAWRRLASRPANELLTEDSLASALEEFGLAPGDAAVGDLADELRQFVESHGTVGPLAGAFAAAERFYLGRAFGAWLADALLAQKLGWSHALPLLGTEPSLARAAARPGRSTDGARATETEPERARKLLAAQARAALRAIDLSSEFERRAQKLLAVAPKLRAKGADIVVEDLLSEDALVASRKGRGQNGGMSDRAQRRLFDRLKKLGAVRELSGRPTFRIYGL